MARILSPAGLRDRRVLAARRWSPRGAARPPSPQAYESQAKERCKRWRGAMASVPGGRRHPLHVRHRSREATAIGTLEPPRGRSLYGWTLEKGHFAQGLRYFNISVK